VAIFDKLRPFKLPFGPKAKPADDERLVQLFKNRADLKKQYQDLQDEIYDLKQRLKQQETATGKAQEQMDSLETLLGNPQSGYTALVYYQLRGLWRACNLQLAQFAGELERQQEERERQRQTFEFNQQLRGRLEQVDTQLAAANDVAAERQRILDDLTQRLQKMRGFWNYFRRRKLAAQIAGERVHVDAAIHDAARLREEHATIEQEQCPAFPGLSTDGRRAINLAIIAYALVLGARLSTEGLATRVRESMTQRVHEAQFGGRDNCEAMMMAIAQATGSVKSRSGFAAQIKTSVELLKEAAQYRAEADTVPLAESLAGIAPPSPDGRPMLTLSAPQILADDYWSIYRVLLR
jgi:chromosome segregation ATPase